MENGRHTAPSNNKLLLHQVLLETWGGVDEKWLQERMLGKCKAFSEERGGNEVVVAREKLAADREMRTPWTPEDSVDKGTSLSGEHVCERDCAVVEETDQRRHYLSPLALPLLSGWKRSLVRGENGCRVCYSTPCERKIQSMEELEQFLKEIPSLAIRLDMFCFDPDISCGRSYERFLGNREVNFFMDDISNGRERIPVPCANWLSEEKPASFHYCSQRVVDQSVSPAIGRPEFMVRCTCQDNCHYVENCPCRQLTLQEANIIRSQGHGYSSSRLPSHQISAVYECNEHCSCGPNCQNRVVQRGPLHRVLVFMTVTMGWGLMTLDDIPQGAFVCCYAGKVYPGHLADEKAARSGDDYQAELDYIEIMERVKEGYESDVVSPSPYNSDLNVNESETSSSLSAPCRMLTATTTSPPCSLPLLNHSLSSPSSPPSLLPQSSCWLHAESTLPHLPPSLVSLAMAALPNNPSIDHTPSSSISHSPSSVRHSYSHCSPTSSDDSYFLGSAKRPRVTLSSTEEDSDASLPSSQALSTHSDNSLSMRSFLFDEQQCYVIDALECGNVGRFINHSCSPNLFVQNVFVDSHDLRFPWVAFFAKRNIEAGSELFWDYNYIPGSVEGRILHCRCGSQTCRGRLI